MEANYLQESIHNVSSDCVWTIPVCEVSMENCAIVIAEQKLHTFKLDVLVLYVKDVELNVPDVFELDTD